MQPSSSNPFIINWDHLLNPIYEHKGWSVKDACMIAYDEKIFLFFSAFYRDRWRERSHIVGVYSQDGIRFSDPFLLIDGKKDGWTGMCSPSIRQINDTFYLLFNSWGDVHPNHQKNQLLFATSTDLIHWSTPQPIAKNLTEGIRCIDIEMYFQKNQYIIMWKERLRGFGDRPRIAIGSQMTGPFHFIQDGLMRFYLANNQITPGNHENFQIFRIQSKAEVKFYCLVTVYGTKMPNSHLPYLYEMQGNGELESDWLTWIHGRPLDIPQEQFNTNHRANSPFLTDWSDNNGYYYLLYAGRTEGVSHAGRGNNKLGIARSKDLIHWVIPTKKNL